MLIHGKIANSTVNGPGNRAVIWFQSCMGMSCRFDCWNKNTHSLDLNKEESLDSLCEWVQREAKDCSLTLSGGEPMQQAYLLEHFLYRLKKENPKLSIGMYTGYTKKELDLGHYHYIVNKTEGSIDKEYVWCVQFDHVHNPWDGIRKELDFAIMGRFNKLKLDTSTSLRSSTNQELVLFSDRYKESDFRQQEIQFNIKDGLVNITGFPVGMTELLESRNW